MTRKQKCLAALVFLDVLLPIGCGIQYEPGTEPGGPNAPIFSGGQYLALEDIQIRVRRIEARLDDLLREADASVEEGR